MPTVTGSMDLASLAENCGYPHIYQEVDLIRLKEDLQKIKNSTELCFVEICCGISSRSDLGRPTTSPEENKRAFMRRLT